MPGTIDIARRGDGVEVVNRPPDADISLDLALAMDPNAAVGTHLVFGEGPYQRVSYRLDRDNGSSFYATRQDIFHAPPPPEPEPEAEPEKTEEPEPDPGAGQEDPVTVQAAPKSAPRKRAAAKKAPAKKAAPKG